MKTAIAFLIYLASIVTGTNLGEFEIDSIYEYRILESAERVVSDEIVNYEEKDFTLRGGFIRVAIDSSKAFENRFFVIKEEGREPEVLVFEKYYNPEGLEGAEKFNQGGENFDDGHYMFLAFEPDTHEQYLVISLDRGFTKVWKFHELETGKQFAYITTHAKDVTRQILSHKKTESH